MGPILGENLKLVPLLGSLCELAPRHGCKVVHNQGFWELWHEATGKVLVVHDADTPAEKYITRRVVKDPDTHRDELRQKLT